MIACGRLERGKKHPKLENYLTINVSSMSFYTNPFRNQSPMVMKKCFWQQLKEPGFINIGLDFYKTPETFFENFWQSRKCYFFDFPKNWISPGLNECRDEIPLDSFFKRSLTLINNEKPKRRPLPKKVGIPVASYIKNQVIG